MDAYQMLDKFSKGWVTVPEIIESLGELGAYPHKDDVYLFIRRYDKDGDGRFSTKELTDWMVEAGYLKNFKGLLQSHKN